MPLKRTKPLPVLCYAANSPLFYAKNTMLELKANGQTLEIDPNTTISFTATNPITDKDNIKRGFSFPFRIPPSPANLHARAHNIRLDARRRPADVPGTLTFASSRVFSGVVRQQKASAEGEEISLANTPLDVWKALGDFKISEILEEVFIPQTVQAQWIYSFNATPNTYAIALDNVLATATANNPGELNTAIGSIATQLNAANPGVATWFPGEGTIKLQSSIINQHPVIQIVSVQLQSAISVAEAREANMEAHINYVIDNDVETHCFPAIQWDRLYSGQNIFFEGIVNRFLNEALFPNTLETEKAWRNTVIPMLRVPYVLRRIQERLGLAAWHGAVFDADFIQKLIVVNNYTLDDTTYERYPDGPVNNVQRWRGGYKASFKLNNHVPEITAAAFIKAICDTFALELNYADGGLSFARKQDSINNTPMVLDGYVSADYDVERNYSDGWAIRYTTNPAEQFDASGHLNPVVSGAGENVLYIPPSFHKYSGAAINPFVLAKVPITAQPGVSDSVDGSKGRSTLPITWLFYYGVQPASNSQLYPFASYDNRNYFDSILGTDTLDIDTPEGLYIRHHKGVIELSTKDTLTIPAVLPIGQLQKLLTFRQSRVKFYHPHGEVVGVLSAISYALSQRGLTNIKLEILK